MQRKVKVEVLKAKEGAYGDLKGVKSSGEVREALKKMKSVKALCPNDIPGEVQECLER